MPGGNVTTDQTAPDTEKRSWFSLLREMCRHCWDLFAPPACPGCGTHLSPDAIDTCFCTNCRDLADPVDSPCCPQCRAPRTTIPGRSTKGVDLICRQCHADPPPFDVVHVRWLYRDSISDAIRAGKYASELWRLRRLADTTRSWAHDVIAPQTPGDVGICAVPMAPKELRARGFNHASLLARWWFGREDQPAVKPVATEPQAGLPREERIQNLNDAFELRDTAAVSSRPWVIIDDVVTTGATARELAGTLKRAGAPQVQVLALARAP